MAPSIDPISTGCGKKSREGKSCQTDVKILKESLICITSTQCQGARGRAQSACIVYIFL